MKEDKKCQGFIGTLDQAAQYQKDKYLFTGYRVNYRNKRSLAKTFFMFHNESMNIWIHVTGVFIFLTMIFLTYISYTPPTMTSRLNVTGAG